MIKGMLNVALGLLGIIFLREALLSEGPDHYVYPRVVAGRTVYDRSESFNPSYLPAGSGKTYIFFAVSKHRSFFQLQKWSLKTGTESVTVISKVNFCKINGFGNSIFSDNGHLHVLSGNNDTLVYVKNQINWLPESVKLKGDSVVLSNDTARVTVPVYTN